MSTAPTFDELLSRLGCDDTALRPDERAALDTSGFVLLDGLIDAATLPRWRQAFEALDGRSDAATAGTRHLPDLLAVSDAFDGAAGHPRLLAAVRHLLGRPFALQQCSGRDPLPGHGAQGLHTDWLPLQPGEPAAVVTALWMLDAFTATNGATRLVPGSHQRPGPVPKGYRAPAARHPDERRGSGPAGAVLLFSGHVWHAGARNDSDGPRRALQIQWVARDRRPSYTRLPAPAGRSTPLAVELAAVLGD